MEDKLKAGIQGYVESWAREMNLNDRDKKHLNQAFHWVAKQSAKTNYNNVCMICGNDIIAKERNETLPKLGAEEWLAKNYPWDGSSPEGISLNFLVQMLEQYASECSRKHEQAQKVNKKNENE